MSIKTAILNSHTVNSESWIAKNNLVIIDPIFVKKEWAIVDKAWANDDIAGVSITSIVAASDNETKDRRVVNFFPKSIKNQYEITISWGTVTEADENKNFNLKDEQTVDGSTASSWTKLRLVKFINDKKWIFEIN